MRRLMIAALAALAPACTTVQFDGQEVELRYVEEEGEEDALELTLRYRGMHAPTSPWVQDGTNQKAAVDWVRRLERKERVFTIFGWPLDFDLDKESLKPTKVEALLLESVRVTHAELYLDQDGRLCADQRIRWDGVKSCVAAINDDLNQEVERGLKVDGEVELDEASLTLLADHVAEGRPWFLLTAERLRLRLPITAAGLAKLPDQENTSPEDALEDLRTSMGADLVGSDARGVYLDWKFDEGGVLRLVDEVGEEPGSFSLRDRLIETGSKLETRDW